MPDIWFEINEASLLRLRFLSNLLLLGGVGARELRRRPRNEALYLFLQEGFPKQWDNLPVSRHVWLFFRLLHENNLFFCFTRSV